MLPACGRDQRAGILLCGSIVSQVAQIKQSNPYRAPQKVLTRRQSYAAPKERHGTWPFEDSGLRLEHIRNQVVLRGDKLSLLVRDRMTDKGRDEISMLLFQSPQQTRCIYLFGY